MSRLHSKRSVFEHESLVAAHLGQFQRLQVGLRVGLAAGDVAGGDAAFKGEGTGIVVVEASQE